MDTAVAWRYLHMDLEFELSLQYETTGDGVNHNSVPSHK
jgi:hypothetical protein